MATPTPSKTAAGTSADPALTTGPKADDLKTEQEKGGKDPVGEAKQPEKLEVVTVGTKEPYPQGKPRDPEEDFVAAHGFKRAKE